ncbi:putative RNA-directed DNA polymerase from transposon X-element [Araneus ventricosus]|uniref:Putative RNA-directed DNA polymerase from transposon X-element n=1 Tax=Araneus ventricosus TaxID=182803 RepID=A0A4Y2S3A6_ARAVE|nr:putative RNA-directed DNA polymerase from transposon X-element [Araneus ventricosus]
MLSVIAWRTLSKKPQKNTVTHKVNLTINKYLRSLNTCSPPCIILPQEVINLMISRETTGPDVLRMLTINAVTHLTKIFNKCLALHHFPASWKLAHELMFPKPHQDRKLTSSYRPISLLSNIGKLNEKLLLKRINEHCNNQNIIPNEQFGFRERHSCTRQLLRVTNKIVDRFNVKHYTGGVF